MPAQLTYPGVYIEEIPSGVHTITGVATSIAAFVGWATKGPTDRAELVLSWSEFERKFAGLNSDSYMSYAVYHFFANGGQQAYIIRLVHTKDADNTKNAASASISISGGPVFTAVDPGLWANIYSISIKNRTDSAGSGRFQISVSFKSNGSDVVVESFDNLSVTPSDPRYIVDVVNAESAIISVTLPSGVTTIADAMVQLTGGIDGTPVKPNASDFETALDLSGSTGVRYLDKVDLFNLLCVPGETTPSSLQSLETFCQSHRAFLIVDCKQIDTASSLNTNGVSQLINGDASGYGAIYFPWISAPDPLSQNRIKPFPPCGFIAGIYARTDTNRGVWKAPAGIEAGLTAVSGVNVPMTDKENGLLNVQGINCIRNFKVYGTVVWGARTLLGNDEIGSDWKYIPVRRMALFLEESLFRGLKWVVFEPNDEPLWSQIRLNAGAFMHNLFVQGAFQGTTPRQAYFVKCDKETTTQNDINNGIVNIIIGFAPLKPAEFVVIKIQQIAGQVQT